MNEAASETVFVYGTLRRGGSNDFRITPARFVAQGAVRGRLYRIDWYPGFVADESGGEVVGEIYEADAETLAALDAFEGREYRRVQIAVEVSGMSDAKVQAWIWEWLGEVSESQRIAGGDWLLGQ